MKKITLTELPLHGSFEVMGHSFRNLDEILDAVSIIARPHEDWSGKIYIRKQQPAAPVPGLYVGLIYEPFPCFDASDYAYENRKYWNFFFSASPISEQHIGRLAAMTCKSNCRYVHENMPEWAAPALYWGGDSCDKPLLATV